MSALSINLTDVMNKFNANAHYNTFIDKLNYLNNFFCMKSAQTFGKMASVDNKQSANFCCKKNYAVIFSIESIKFVIGEDL